MLCWIIIVLDLWNKSAGRYVTAFGHIIVIRSQPDFSPTHWSCTHSREAAYIIYLVFGLTKPGLNTTIYSTWVKHTNHYTTDVTFFCCLLYILKLFFTFSVLQCIYCHPKCKRKEVDRLGTIKVISTSPRRVICLS